MIYLYLLPTATLLSRAARLAAFVGIALLLSGCGFWTSSWTTARTYKADMSIPFTISPPSVAELRTVHLDIRGDVAGMSSDEVHQAIKQQLEARNYAVLDDPEKASYRLQLKLYTMVRTIDSLNIHSEYLEALSVSLEKGGGHQALGLFSRNGGLEDAEVATRSSSKTLNFLIGGDVLEYYVSLVARLRIDERIDQRGHTEEILASEDALAVTPVRRDFFLTTLAIRCLEKLPRERDHEGVSGIQEYLPNYVANLF